MPCFAKCWTTSCVDLPPSVWKVMHQLCHERIICCLDSTRSFSVSSPPSFFSLLAIDVFCACHYSHWIFWSTCISLPCLSKLHLLLSPAFSFFFLLFFQSSLWFLLQRQILRRVGRLMQSKVVSVNISVVVSWFLCRTLVTRPTSGCGTTWTPSSPVYLWKAQRRALPVCSTPSMPSWWRAPWMNTIAASTAISHR